MAKVLEGEILGREAGESGNSGREERVRRKFWATLRKAAARIPLIEEPIAAYYCAFDPATPARTRAILLGALAYFVLPADMVPDFLALVGFTDDASVLALAIRSVRGQMLPRHRQAAKAAVERLAA